MSDEFENDLIARGVNPDDLEDPDDFINHDFKPIPVDKLDKKIEEELGNFTALLGTLSSTEDRQKALWKQIYEHALVDRRNAYILFGDLYNQVAGKNDQHAIHGQTLSKYLERMSKTTDQLIKLADLVDQAVEQETEENWSEEEMYGMLEKNSQAKKNIN